MSSGNLFFYYFCEFYPPSYTPSFHSFHSPNSTPVLPSFRHFNNPPSRTAPTLLLFAFSDGLDRIIFSFRRAGSCTRTGGPIEPICTSGERVRRVHLSRPWSQKTTSPVSHKGLYSENRPARSGSSLIQNHCIRDWPYNWHPSAYRSDFLLPRPTLSDRHWLSQRSSMLKMKDRVP